MGRSWDSSNLSDRDEEDLVAGFREGDPASLSAIVSRYQNGLLKEFLTLGCRRHDAEDLVQETFLRAFERVHEYRSNRGRFRSWLYGIGYTAFKERRRVLRQRRLGREEYLEIRSRFWSQYLRDQCAPSSEADPLVEIWEILTDLPDRDRLLIHLRFSEEMTIDDLGVVFDLKPMAVRMRIHRILKKLRRRFEARRHVKGSES